jgi:hypothetical protein
MLNRNGSADISSGRFRDLLSKARTYSWEICTNWVFHNQSFKLRVKISYGHIGGDTPNYKLFNKNDEINSKESEPCYQI